jgi:exosome complex RNA-binding protein Rrp42 (RNase PH superfamily)
VRGHANICDARMANPATISMCSTLVDSRAFDLKSLCVAQSKFAWHLYVDVLVLNSGGSLADVCALAAVAALSDVRLPGLKLLAGEREGDVNVDVDDNPLASTRLSIADLPLTLSFHVINNALVVDARLEEEACAQGRMLVSLNRFVHV